jgi:Ca-activated chloride channel family protein
VRARTVPLAERKPANLVFLVDVSGSMGQPDKLPLAQRSLRILTENLRAGDTVALVTYAGSTRVVLPPTGMEERARIVAAIDELSANGSTAMGSGLELAYRLAVRQVRPGVVSRIIVLSDGDANVGPTTHEEILRTVQGYAQEGVTVSTVGFGMGNYHDTLMEQLADRANGNNYYIDTPFEARRVFEEQLGGTLEVVAQDVKIQVDFDPRVVTSYRLVGYENRDVADEDFRNDRVDAGEIGSGHDVNALYEIRRAPGAQGPLATVRLRAKTPGGSVATEWQTPLAASALRPSMELSSADLRFAAAVMGLAEILRGSPHAQGWRLETVLALARSATRAGDRDRQELVELVQTLTHRAGQ